MDAGDPADDLPFRPPGIEVESASTFSLGTLFQIMTLAAVCLGIAVVLPGLGVPLAILSTLALVRTRVLYRAHLALDARWTSALKYTRFVESLGVALLVLLAGGVAGFCVCWCAAVGTLALTDNDLPVMISGFGCGIAAGGAVGWLVLRGNLAAARARLQLQCRRLRARNAFDLNPDTSPESGAGSL